MEDDPIVAEVRRIRQEHAAQFDFDLEAIYRNLKEQETEGKREVVSLAPKPVLPVEVGVGEDGAA